MTWLFLALLGVAWMAIFLPAALRARRRTPLPSAEGFKRKQASLNLSAGSAPGRWVLMPQSPGGRVQAARRRTQAHRRRMFVALLWSSVLSGAVAVLRGGALWEVHLALDACLGIYVALLIDAKKRRSAPSKKVSQLPQHRPEAPPHEEPVLEQAVGQFGGRRH